MEVGNETPSTKHLLLCPTEVSHEFGKTSELLKLKVLHFHYGFMKNFSIGEKLPYSGKVSLDY